MPSSFQCQAAPATECVEFLDCSSTSEHRRGARIYDRRMSSGTAASPERAHWDAVWTRVRDDAGVDAVSWYQASPEP
jgi:hypothetical protein